MPDRTSYADEKTDFYAHGLRVDDWALDQWDGEGWKEFAKGTGIGNRRLWRGDSVTTDKVRLRITKAAACPAIAEFALHLEFK